MKSIAATRYKIVTRVFLILLVAGVISAILYVWITDGASVWQFGSKGFSLIQNFNQGFARLVTGGEFAGGFRRRGLFGDSRYFAGLIGILRNLALIAVMTLGVVVVQKLYAYIHRKIRRGP